MKDISDEVPPLEQYMTDLANNILGGKIGKRHATILIEALIDRLAEIRKPYMEESHEAMQTLSAYFVEGVNRYIRSLNTMKSYLLVPRKETIHESMELAASASMIMRNVQMLTLETDSLLNEFLQGGEIIEE